MYKMKYKDFINYSYKYVCLSFSLVATFWAISLFEFIVSASRRLEQINFLKLLSYRFINDLWTGFGIALLFLPLYLMFYFIKKPIGNIVIKVLFSLIVIGQFALAKYYLTTLINLGADFLGYSLGDMYTTVMASESLSLLYFLPFILFPLLFLGINYAFNKYTNTRHILISAGILILVFGSSKIIFSEASETVYQNKLYYFGADIFRFQQEKNIADAYVLSNRNDYPLLKPFQNSKDVLGSFFNIKEEKPNIVIIIVEGLGTEFVGENTYRGFTPYLDALISKSLYWENFLSTTGRTFGVLPALLGSLPYGENGFLESNPLPSHLSLISILKANNYTTSFYTGDDSSFDKKIRFLEYNDVDHIIDENKFGPEYIKTKENSGGFSWGYPDDQIFKKILSELDGKKQPRLDIIMTLTNHEPFSFPSKSSYLLKVDSILNSKQLFGVKKSEILANKDIFASLLYTDNSLENFMTEYAKRPEYSNTIFIITGDHRLIPIAQKDKLCRFHVPFFIFSPMLKQPVKFKSISSHLDVTPSLLSFLLNNYKFNKLNETAWIGKGIDTAKEFRNIHQIPLMRNKGTITDFVYKDYFFADGTLFKIDEKFGMNKVKDEKILKIISDSLIEFKKLNAYLTKKNRIFPDSLNIYVKIIAEFSKEELAIITKLINGLGGDEIFNLAREKAFGKDYKTAILLCDYILNERPNHADARTLKGRVLAWDNKYEQAEVELLSVLKRKPYYSDCYLALLDLYWWSKQDKKAINIAMKAKENGIDNVEISFKLAQAYKRMNNFQRANKVIDSILKLHPKNEAYITFKKSLKK